MQGRKKLILFSLICLSMGMLFHGCSSRDPGQPTEEMYAAQTAASSSLGIILMRETECIQDKLVNQDKDGRGEFALLGELAGEIVPRGSSFGTPIKNPLLASGYRTGGANGPGYAHRQGYYFRIYLPATPDTAGDDRTLGGTPTRPGPEVRRDVVNFQEKHFALYAWPQRSGTIPEYALAFFMNESGRIYHQIGTKYIGEDNPPPAEAAYAGPVFTSEIHTSAWKPIYGAEKETGKTF
ncbi:MAG: hypothetical protein AB1696_18850 [Planctomycetota bacterium]